MSTPLRCTKQALGAHSGDARPGLRCAGHRRLSSSGARLLNAPTAICTAQRRTICAAAAATEQDAWIATALNDLDVANRTDNGNKLADLKNAAQEALSSARMPTTRDEEFKFTDLSSLLGSSLCPPSKSTAGLAEQVQELRFDEATDTQLTMVDGVLDLSLSKLAGLPDGVYIGPLADAPAWAVEKLGAQATASRGVFASLNSALAADVTVVSIENGAKMASPLHIVLLSSPAEDASKLAASAPRLLVCMGKGSSAEIIEEYETIGDGSAFSTSVTEIDLAEDAELQHSYLQMSNPSAGTHTKLTCVRQASNSSYKLVESRLGGTLTRHDVQIEQLGPETSTTMRHFLLCAKEQLHDLHTKLTLDHPNGVADQLHKCISGTQTSRGVFDGNVKVNQAAQQTDAGQLSRNLLLAPRATVNVKPNLQIIADDVKCTHGCTVSDLSDEELFYFASRGIDSETARDCLVFSFGAEIIQEHGYDAIVKRLEDRMKSLLSSKSN